jgi:mutator protein MutT
MADLPPPGDVEPVRVGIALVRRRDAFLVRERPEGAPLAGLWEFPGGKCEPGESPAEAAARECREELGIAVALGALRRVVRHRYAHGPVELYYYDGRTADDAGEPAADSGFRWVGAEALESLQFPQANAEVVRALAEEFARPAAPAGD